MASLAAASRAHVSVALDSAQADASRVATNDRVERGNPDRVSSGPFVRALVSPNIRLQQPVGGDGSIFYPTVPNRRKWEVLSHGSR
jgi:hypothetical protein